MLRVISIFPSFYQFHFIKINTVQLDSTFDTHIPVVNIYLLKYYIVIELFVNKKTLRTVLLINQNKTYKSYLMMFNNIF